MMFNKATAALAVLPAVSLATAQGTPFIPPPTDTTSFQSSILSDVSVSYKQTTICETTPGVKSYTGFISVPGVTNGSVHNIFFWYFEARKTPRSAPSMIYVPGGPASSFLAGGPAFPCTFNSDSNSTTLNPWSFNNEVNSLFIDIPIGGGYSYTKPLDGVYNLLLRTFTPGSTASNSTAFGARLSSKDPMDGLGTTGQVARQVWAISQVMFNEFPGHKTTNDEIHLWSYSYGGLTGPASLNYIRAQNDKIAAGTLGGGAKRLNVAGFGTMNGCSDSLIQADSMIEFAVNNTYGIKIAPDSFVAERRVEMEKVKEAIKQCRALQTANDPEWLGIHPQTVEACKAAGAGSFQVIMSFDAGGRSAFDINLEMPGDDVLHYEAGFFNRRWVQQAVGAPVNFTFDSDVVPQAFVLGFGDNVVPSVKALDSLAAAGLKMTFVYGDRDHRCNWFGMEKVSLSMEYPAAASFRSAGYTNIVTNSSYVGGKVRQHGNVSFSRVYHAGHAVADYQPETVWRIFQRTIGGRDVATGQVPADQSYSSTGEVMALGKVPLQPAPETFCNIYGMGDRKLCSEEQNLAFANGTAIVKDFIVVSPPLKKNGLGLGPAGQFASGGPGGPGATGGLVPTSSPTPTAKPNAAAVSKVNVAVLACVVAFAAFF